MFILMKLILNYCLRKTKISLVEWERGLINRDNFGKKNGVIILTMAKKDGVQWYKNIRIKEMMVLSKKLESGGKKSRVSLCLEKNGLKSLKKMIIIGKKNLINILCIRKKKSYK